jgi:hypothetical protein
VQTARVRRTAELLLEVAGTTEGALIDTFD